MADGGISGSADEAVVAKQADGHEQNECCKVSRTG
jgi:hypothetical protein